MLLWQSMSIYSPCGKEIIHLKLFNSFQRLNVSLESIVKDKIALLCTVKCQHFSLLKESLISEKKKHLINSFQKRIVF